MVRQNVFATTLLPTFERVVTPPRNRNSSLVRGTASMSMSTVQYRYNISCSARKSTNNPIRGLGETPIIPLGPPSVGFPRVFSASAGSSMDRSLYHKSLRPFHRSLSYHLLNKYTSYSTTNSMFFGLCLPPSCQSARGQAGNSETPSPRSSCSVHLAFREKGMIVVLFCSLTFDKNSPDL